MTLRDLLVGVVEGGGWRGFSDSDRLQLQVSDVRERELSRLTQGFVWGALAGIVARALTRPRS